MKTQTTQKQVSKSKQQPKQQPKQKQQKAASLYRFEMVPMGRMLRAYFVALIACQTGGKLKADAPFKLWPAVNLYTHMQNKRIVRKDGAFALTTAGYNYFTDPVQAADPEMLETMTKAVQTGQPPKAYNVKMLPL